LSRHGAPADGPLSAEEAKAVLREADLLCCAARVDEAIERMAAEITASLADREPVVIAVMVGGLIPAGRIVSKLEFPLDVDYVHATRYRGGTRGGEVHWLCRPSTPLRGRTVLLIDDILDEGHTLAAILESCAAEGAREVASAVLVRKRGVRQPAVERPDFVGLTIENRYAFGCGMDYRGKFRNLPAVYAVKGL